MLSNSDRRIVLITHEFYPKRGGIATYAEEMARGIVEKGYPFEMWASRRSGFSDRAFPFDLKAIANEGRLDWRSRLKTAAMMRRGRSLVRDSILYLPEPGPILTMMYRRILCLPMPAKLILTLHGSEILRLSSSAHQKRLFGRLLVDSFRIGVVSEYTRDLLLERFPGVRDKTRLVPGALSHRFTEPPPRTRSTDDGRIRILTVARIDPRKGQHVIVKALSLLPAHLRERIEYQIVGPIVREGYARRLEALCRQFSIRAVFTGEVSDSDLQRHYADADIFAMTSVPRGFSVEGFGLVYLEAGACGLPVIGHKIGGVAEAVRDGETGLLVEPGDETALTDSFAKLIASPEMRRSFGRAGRKRAADSSWTRNVEQLFGP